MKIFYKFVTLALAMFVAAACALAQEADQASILPRPPATVLSNWTEAVGTVVSSSSFNWAGNSEFVSIPGAAVFSLTSTTTVLYLGFTGGSEADIGNMVLYTTARGSSAVTKVTKVTLGAVSNPMIHLTSTSVCPTQPVSPAHPCFIKLDTIKAGLSPLNDYYFAVYFTLDTNNEQIAAAGQSVAQGALTGWTDYGDQTRIGVMGALPTDDNGGQAPFFVLYVTNE